MLNREYCYSVFSVGCEYKRPKGGIAQVLHTYSQLIFNPFRCVVNLRGDNKIAKILTAFVSFIYTFVVLLFDRRVKILHIHTASNNSFKRSSYWVRLGNLLNKKVVMHIHGGGFKDYYAKNPVWVKGILDKCDGIVVLSQSWYHYFSDELGCKKLFVVKNIVPNPSFRKINKDDDKVHLLFLGLLCQQKGIFDLLEVLAEHKEELAHKVVLHVGGNGNIQTFMDKVRTLGLEACVKFEGFVSGEKKIELLNLSDVFVLPSYVEGLPISILEAMSYNMPIISTNVGGIPEIVKSNENGFLFNPGDKDALYGLIMKLVSDTSLRQYMGKVSATVIKDYLPSSVETQLLSIYKTLLV